ncbi:bifunctional phosphoglucose/phosphomannose isomerase [Candidatus Woesearchaeota archaeon]|nr:bifunctional phosphoglucose/phosphomannose isomerase [Candidatus Woesearchaeota archaeon]
MAVDNSNVLAVIEDFPKQIKESLSLPKGITAKRGINKIIVAGMGGSAISGDILALLMEKSGIPVFVVRDYSLPSFADDKTLVFAVSYSGETEETLSAVEDAKSKGCSIIGITSGGTLSEKCGRVIRIPSGLSPRQAIGYLLFPMLGIASNSGFVSIKSDDVNELVSTLNSKRESFREKARELASKIDGKLAVIYSSQRLSAVAYRFKTQLNENSKVPAYHNTFPELDHNEIVGYEGMDRRSYIAVVIEDNEDNERIRKRISVTKDIMKGNIDIISIKTIGNSLLCRTMATINFLDYVSYYLAIRRRTDPGPVKVIDELKESMKK